MRLMQLVEEEKKTLIHRLINMGYTRTPDGKDLQKLTLTEVNAIYQNQKRREELGIC
ncbi:Fur-regulated basic protein FbpA [Sutcliffiella horikoshii]|uniref:Fur-regulated basic protein FbpA n=1 Tax=Sutcliffiella horikoshii TaxID=79883 RepID=A0A5D4T229_9BACI|nr:Fur-regulated basic protein FbpA [Sutcliffiella horikoshii]TYS68678.1 Fur-regulated basic protein FbpA [Sutcliffiella horikoshii]